LCYNWLVFIHDDDDDEEEEEEEEQEQEEEEEEQEQEEEEETNSRFCQKIWNIKMFLHVSQGGGAQLSGRHIKRESGGRRNLVLSF